MSEARTTKVPGRLTPLERRTIERAIAGELEPKLVQRWLAFLLRAYDSQEENTRIREGKVKEETSVADSLPRGSNQVDSETT